MVLVFTYSSRVLMRLEFSLQIFEKRAACTVHICRLLSHLTNRCTYYLLTHLFFITPTCFDNYHHQGAVRMPTYNFSVRITDDDTLVPKHVAVIRNK